MDAAVRHAAEENAGIVEEGSRLLSTGPETHGRNCYQNGVSHECGHEHAAEKDVGIGEA